MCPKNFISLHRTKVSDCSVFLKDYWKLSPVLNGFTVNHPVDKLCRQEAKYKRPICLCSLFEWSSMFWVFFPENAFSPKLCWSRSSWSWLMSLLSWASCKRVLVFPSLLFTLFHHFKLFLGILHLLSGYIQFLIISDRKRIVMFFVMS